MMSPPTPQTLDSLGALLRIIGDPKAAAKAVADLREATAAHVSVVQTSSENLAKAQVLVKQVADSRRELETLRGNALQGQADLEKAKAEFAQQLKGFAGVKAAAEAEAGRVSAVLRTERAAFTAQQDEATRLASVRDGRLTQRENALAAAEATFAAREAALVSREKAAASVLDQAKTLGRLAS